MTDEAYDVNSIPIRVNDLERAKEVHEHRLRTLEEERLPHRMVIAERSAAEAQQGVNALKGEVAQLRTDQAKGFRALERAVGRIGSLFKGAMWAFGVIGTVLVVLNLVVDLIPKLDAIIIDKNPPVEMRK